MFLRSLLALALLRAAAAGTATVTAASSGGDAASLARRLQIINESGESLAVAWVHPITGEAVPYWSGADAERLAVDSFVNHTFLLRPANVPGASDVADGTTAHSTYSTFTVSEAPTDHIIHVKRGFELVTEEIPAVPQPPARDDRAPSAAAALVAGCRADADQARAAGRALREVYTALTDCLERGTAALLERQTEALAFEAHLRKTLAAQAENHTCADPAMETSAPLRETTWTHHRTGHIRRVGILHDRPASRIHIVHDFISDEECRAVENAARSTLHRGTVADGKGGSRLSESRKAWQAGLKVNWDKEHEGDLIAALDRRVFDYTNDVMGYNMSVAGQEDLMSIQYFGNGTNDPAPDRYMPHCDGDCDGMPHKNGGRVATMVMYCDVPELGGGTNFQQAHVFVKPTKGAAAFFAYMDPDTRRKESGFTTHSGCPVLEGTKRIAVQWMRIGVDAENPWDSFDTNTVSTKQKKGFYDL